MPIQLPTDSLEQQQQDHKELQRQLAEQGLLHAKDPVEIAIDNFVTEELKDLVSKARQLIMRPEPVLITGESGTGKELIAKILHGNRDIMQGGLKPCFVDVNCAALPGNLFESELFGYKKGSHSTALEDRPGMIESAYMGTMFMDEVGDLPLEQQAKLLRVLQTRTIRRVGDILNRNVTCRFVFATNKNLAEEVEKGRFREDLYYRISVFELHIPALRDRPKDIKPIIRRIIVKEGIDADDIPSVIPEKAYVKGNVRALERWLKRLSIGWEE
jgi:transcriptional regulator with PAS, ATPase and Fis domain